MAVPDIYIRVHVHAKVCVHHMVTHVCMRWRACMLVRLCVWVEMCVPLKDVCNQGSWTAVLSDSFTCNAMISGKTLSLWLIFYPMPGHLVLWQCLWLEACLDLTIQASWKFFFCHLFFLHGNTLYRNQLIKDAECQCGVTGIGNSLCHEGEESGAYVSVPCVVKLLAESHLDQRGNRVYWAELTCSVWPLKSWSRTLHKSVSSFKTRTRTCLLTCRTLSPTVFLRVRKSCKSAQTLRPCIKSPLPSSSQKHTETQIHQRHNWLTDIYVT